MDTRRGAPLPRAVWLLGWVSLATDAASEAIYPLLPFFVTSTLGGGVWSLGVIEGVAEAVNSLVRLASGRWSDRRARRRPLVLLGYGLSSTVRPLISLAGSWAHVFGIRFLDRVGKGLRGAPRDAMLATLATSDTRGRVFGFHRGMDHAGAILGPVLASIFLLWQPGAYRTLFALTLVPGAIAVLLLALVREPAAVVATVAGPRPGAIEPLPTDLRRFFVVLGLFTLGNSTDAFLLLHLTDAAGSVTAIPLAWAALHVVKSTTSFIAGAWSDRIGRVRVIGLGWVVYAVVYLGFAGSQSWGALLAWFLIYGLYFGLVEGAEKALVADLSPESARGTAFGVYTTVQGIGSLAASVLFGALWTWRGPAVAFSVGAALALLATLALFASAPSFGRPSTATSPRT